jgi:hypothetical protein
MKLSKKEFLDILKDKRACPDAVEWVKESKAETFMKLWNECERADWMLWILARMIKEKGWPSRKTVVLCTCDCAETSLQFVPEKENRPKIAIQTARKWAEGKASKIECGKAADAASAAYAAYADAAADAAAYAAFAVYADASSAAYASSASVYAAHAAHAAAHAVYVVSAASYSANAAYASYAAAYASYSAAVASKKEALKNMADIIRKRVS